jgi:ubiquinone/menaquinone biosynthesis C-methylase UbiE
MSESPESKARQIFGERASFYTTSATHTDPQILARVVELVQPRPDWVALDVATGTGHTAFAVAPHVTRVVAIDLTPQMLAEARRLQIERNIPNVEFRVADVHDLPFDSASFDLVTSRRAPHHFSDIAKALREIRRVLRPGGRLVIDDRSVAEDDFVDQVMNELDVYHDESHVREYRPSEWRHMLTECGFAVDAVEPYEQHRPLTSFTARVDAANVARIHARLDSLTPQQRSTLKLADVNGEPYINHWYVMLAAHAA